MRPFSVIVAASMPEFGIGFQNKLPWKISQEMKYFKQLTSTVKDETKMNAVIMGRNTWQSIPSKFRPLPNRLNVVLTRTPNSEIAQSISAEKDTLVASSLDEAIDKLSWPPYRDMVENVFVIGGSQLYASALSHNALDSVYLTKVYQSFECDTHFKLDINAFDEAQLSERQRSGEKDSCDVEFQFFQLRKIANPTPDNEEKSSQSVPDCIDDRSHEEYQYLDLIQKVIDTGVERGDRTGTGTLSVFGSSMRFSLRDDVFPLLTTKRVFWRGLAEELLWFMRGCTNAKELSDKKVRIWDGNGSREFLDQRGLSHYAEGDLGPVYGFQWRHFGAKYVDYKHDYSGQGVDQLAEVIHTIKTNPNSRRIVMSAWNPADLNKMALPPCHMFCQFYVANGELSCQMYQRSADMGLGVPFNIASYALLTRLIAQVCGLKAGDFVHCIGDTHVYLNHVEPLKEQLQRQPRQFPILKINPNKTNIDDFVYEDFKIIGYKPQATIKMKMAV